MRAVSGAMPHRCFKLCACCLGVLFFALLSAGAYAAAPTGLAPPPASDQGNSFLSAAALNVSDQLDLVSTNLFAGGLRAFSAHLNVFVSSTIPASKPAASSSNKYQDAELLLPYGGVLNLSLSYGSTNLGTYSDISDADRKADGVGRSAISDRWYFHDPRITVKAAEQGTLETYFPNGVEVKMVNRDVDSTSAVASSNPSTSQATNVSQYGISTLAYFGIGEDAALSDPKGGLGNLRAEVAVQGGWTDRASVQAMYPKDHVTTTNVAVIGTFQLSIINSLSVNLHAGWPLGTTRHYMGRVLLAGITLSR